ncbi:omega-conotoxin-like protein 1 [Copidosoma floridanum]|uniref:omega-conotoxin-like protein 1 n=1 Tax=Copidosoma floridanum TaxID=29053 RepID=UPI0006C93EBD|nr:omega-conotoxin-like protein 1 [Copidosoma floridanum]
MFKIILFALAALLVTTLISGATLDKKHGRHGDICTSQKDCGVDIEGKQLSCNRYANRCQIQITAEDLIRQKSKLKHVEPHQRKGYTDIYSK